MRIGSFLIVTLLGSCEAVMSQSATDVYMFAVASDDAGLPRLADGHYLTGLNAGGYTHQPWFDIDGGILFSVRNPAGEQHDVWALYPDSTVYWQVTKTAANEFSPRSTPDPGYLSALRQLPIDTPVQQVVRFARAGGKPEILTPALSDIGYYTWIDHDELALFVIANGANQMVHYNIRTGTRRIVADKIGRCLLTLPNTEVMFVHKVADDHWYLKTWHPVTGSITLIAETPGQTEDFARLPDGTVLMGKDNLIFALFPRHAPVWKEVADLSALGIRHITRLAADPEGRRLVVVHERKTP
jgi:hypothetical protein